MMIMSKTLNNELIMARESKLLERVFVEIRRKSCIYQKYIVGNDYRLPLYDVDVVTLFTHEYTNLLNLLRARSDFVYICGDYNIDILKM